MRNRTTVRALLIGIVLLGAFLRFFRLHEIPPGLYPDEAANGLDALHAIDRADYRVFYSANNGREGLFINLQALALLALGVSSWSLRAVSAIAGTLTILAIFSVARALGEILFATNGEQRDATRSTADAFGLLAAFLLAVSSWHLNFSRIGFRAILLPALSSTTIALILRGRQNRRLATFAGAGFLAALSLYTYIASRMVPFIAAAIALDDLVRERRALGAALRRWLLFALAFLVTALPLIGYFAEHPQDFLGRAREVSIFAAEKPLIAFATSAAKTLLMFHIHGDENWRHNVAGSPMLDAITGLLFLVGVAVAVAFLRRSRSERYAAMLLFGWFLAMLLPAMLTTEGVPHALRALGAIPPTILLSALGGIAIVEMSRRWLPDALRGAVAATTLSLILIVNVQHYFHTWAANPNVRGAFRSDLAAIAAFLREHPSERRYVIVNEDGVPLETPGGAVPMPAATVRFLLSDDETITYLTPDRINEIIPEFDRTIIVTTVPPREDLLASLKAAFPSIESSEEHGVHFFKL